MWRRKMRNRISSQMELVGLDWTKPPAANRKSRQPLLIGGLPADEAHKPEVSTSALFTSYTATDTQHSSMDISYNAPHAETITSTATSVYRPRSGRHNLNKGRKRGKKATQPKNPRSLHHFTSMSEQKKYPSRASPKALGPWDLEDWSADALKVQPGASWTVHRLRCVPELFA